VSVRVPLVRAVVGYQGEAARPVRYPTGGGRHRGGRSPAAGHAASEAAGVAATPADR